MKSHPKTCKCSACLYDALYERLEMGQHVIDANLLDHWFVAEDTAERFEEILGTVYPDSTQLSDELFFHMGAVAVEHHLQEMERNR